MIFFHCACAKFLFYKSEFLSNTVAICNHPWKFRENRFKTQQVTSIYVFLAFFRGVPTMIHWPKNSFIHNSWKEIKNWLSAQKLSSLKILWRSVKNSMRYSKLSVFGLLPEWPKLDTLDKNWFNFSFWAFCCS